MNLFDALLEYRDLSYSGAIALAPNQGPGPSCDNYHLFTAHAHNLAFQLGEYTGLDAVLYQKFLSACEEAPGLYNRFPGRIDSQISQDEVLGILYMDYRFNFGAAQKISTYLNEQQGFYNNVMPGKGTADSYLVRHPLIAFAVPFTTKTMISMADEIIWFATELFSTISAHDDTSGKLLQYLQAGMYKGRVRIVDDSIDIWSAVMQQKYPGGAKELFGVYFGADHPFTVFAPDHFRFRPLQ